MNNRIGGRASLAAAFLVLFSAMLDARIAAGLAVVSLLAFSVYEFAQGRRQSQNS